MKGAWISRVQNMPDTTHTKPRVALKSAWMRARTKNLKWKVFTKSSSPHVNIYGNNYWEGVGVSMTLAEFRRNKK
jgi:hypothetical protein